MLITGHTGFKGSWLAYWMLSLGAKVSGLALPPSTSPSLFQLLRLKEDLNSKEGDVRDQSAVTSALRTFAPEVIFHLAAQALVRPSYRDPVGTFATNVMGTAHVLNAARDVPNLQAVVVVTSDKCYENREWIWPYREDEPVGGRDPYSSSKACAELVAAAFRSSYFSCKQIEASPAGIATARAGNVIGGGDWAPDRLVPDLMLAFQRGEPAAIRHPSAVRPWQHVLEPLSGYLMLAERLVEDAPAYSEAWNFGPNAEGVVPVSRLADEVRNAWGGAAAWRPVRDSGLHEAHTLRLDASKAQHRLGWTPRWDLSRTAFETVRWYRHHAAGDDMRQLTSEQIDAYCADPT